MADIENGRCHAKKAPEQGPPLFDHGKITVQAHDIGWLVTGIFTLLAVIVSFWLMSKHLQWYTNKAEQRHIVRILLMVPIYAGVSFASYLFWNHSTPLLLLRDCYESTVLTAFFYLLLMYVSHDTEEQKEVFRKLGLSKENDKARQRRGEQPTKWMFPLGVVRWKPHDGLYFLQLMKWGVLQYCVIRPTTTLAAVILDYSGLYCEDSWSPGWGHIYITVIISVSVSIAMYCLLQLYFPISQLLKPQKPLLKLFAVKAVVFLTFWQATGLSLLTTFSIVKDTQYMTAENINIGIGAILECVEMLIFAVLHIKAFSYKPYVTTSPTKRWRSLMHAFNFKETLRELWDGIVYMVHRMRGREVDVMARRQAALEGIFGQSRIQIQGTRAAEKKPASEAKDALDVRVDIEETMHVGSDRQWLGVGDDYAYSLGREFRRTREKSEGLEESFERELATRGYPRRQPSEPRAAYNLLDPTPAVNPGRSKRRERSWWRQVYSRLSQHEPPDPMPLLPSESLVSPQVTTAASQRNPSKPLVDVRHHTYDDPPPQSAIRSYKASKASWRVPEPQLSEVMLSTPQTSTSPLISTSFQNPPRSPPSNIGPHQYFDANRLSVPSGPPTPDSFLARAFPAMSDTSLSTEARQSIASSQSHQSRVHLSGSAAVVSNGMVMSRIPEVVTLAPPSSPPQASVVHSRDVSGRSNVKRSGPSYRVPVPSLSPPSDMPASPRRTANAFYQEPMIKPRLTRDQIVLPAPLSQLPTRSSHGSPQRPVVSPPPALQSPPTRSSHSRSAASIDRHPEAAAHADATPPSLRRSKHRNYRRYSQDAPPHAYNATRPSRQVSLPLTHEPIFESRASHSGGRS